jgi:hypothetical protein
MRSTVSSCEMPASWKWVWMRLALSRAGRDRHLAVGMGQGRIGQRGAGHVRGRHLLDDVHLVGVDGDRHLVGRRLQLGQHVAGVVGQPLGGFALAFRGERDRAAYLQDHLRAGLADAGQQLIELGQALGALAVLFAHVHVQHGGAGVVAVHRLLDLRVHGHRDVLGEIGRHPLGPVGRGGDDQLLHVLDEQRSIDEVHVLSPRGWGQTASAASRARAGFAASPAGFSPTP